MKWVFLFFVFFYFSGCSQKVIRKDNPQDLFEEALDYFHHHQYQIALEKLKNLKKNFPSSPLIVEVELKKADILFEQELYHEAALEYQNFCDFHPQHKNAPYAIFRVGLSYWKESPKNTSQDLSLLNQSFQAFSQFLKIYPHAEKFREPAKEYMQKIRDLLAEKEYAIAEFYLHRQLIEPASYRLKKIMEQYPDTLSAQKAYLELSSVKKILAEKNTK